MLTVSYQQVEIKIKKVKQVRSQRYGDKDNSRKEGQRGGGDEKLAMKIGQQQNEPRGQRQKSSAQENDNKKSD